jgi:hypothetical protein
MLLHRINQIQVIRNTTVSLENNSTVCLEITILCPNKSVNVMCYFLPFLVSGIADEPIFSYEPVELQQSRS